MSNDIDFLGLNNSDIYAYNESDFKNITDDGRRELGVGGYIMLVFFSIFMFCIFTSFCIECRILEFCCNCWHQCLSCNTLRYICKNIINRIINKKNERINKIKKIEYNRMFIEKQKIKKIKPHNMNCPVCLDEIEDECVLDCKHNFCKKCILEYINFNSFDSSAYNEENGFNSKVKCPICRIKIDL